ncbi:MAG: 23S rRNA (guanosine(2251)-2'-O)-methyltransferase RlmB [Gammaproteobacteria bacterium]|nr:23S rRNA (guanosine(2251)-2'-O)-methyltransferase RlmB [Gammaproteobacteria bacterium]NIM72827.1 23S rRNA (guanosine(2251)-2'-O)-methyltransferase RlmB [Gammaproteobacteria bacterium]NIN38285.1 23S rRNA (guanosine(2251)-2'-O)-methyltransferase RlmB [Gammaproteobacteria bacterium]NIO24575.1 23S rRNA (guanosine(2251)-2'-O)-methyltransferase RlmB [Gammaproteobacteria bacterium]NIO65184.1 23S rRNA (guanosine(2251)-2'-O)-methyltransferase RlmB [Gammaproteobacteria bacterium]
MRGGLVYGRHAVQELLERDPAGVSELWLQQGRGDAMRARARQLATRHGISVHAVARTTLDRMLAGAAHQGIAARYRPSRTSLAPNLDTLLAGLEEPALLLVLDGVQDPHNLGACLRSADAAGADAVIVPQRRAVGLTPTVRKAASGAAEHVPLVTVGNLAEALRRLGEAGVFLFGACAHAGIAYTDADLRGPTALILGGEGRGLRRLTAARCDQLIHIPMRAGVESLNVSVAAALCLFEACRQRGGVAKARGIA